MAFALRSPPEVLLRQCIRAGSVLPRTACPSCRPRPQLLSPVQCSARTYKAAVVTKFGQPFQIQDQEKPSKLDSNEVLISIHGNGINFADILSSKGQYQMKIDPPFTPGSEISGKIVAVGSDVSRYKAGDRVMALLPTGMGGGAEYVCTDAKMLMPVPPALSLVEAAATVVSYGTAMMALTRKARVKPKETVLVTAGAGATGLAITDIARNMFDCQVISVCGGQDKCRLALDRGATHAIDHRADSIRAKVKELTKGRGVDVVLDQVGGDTLTDCIKSLAFEGRAITIGYASGKIPQIPANLLLLKSASLIGVWWGNYALSHPQAFHSSIQQVMKGVSDGKLKPYVGKTFPLNQINEAYQHIVDRKNVGKVVIKVKDEEAPAE